MIMKTKQLKQWIFLVCCVIFCSCTKEFLDKKPSKSLLVPTTLSDFQALMDDVDNVNVAPGLNIISSDDFYRTDATFVSLSPVGQNTYTWAKDLYAGTLVADWDKPYADIFMANVVLDGLKALSASQDAADYNRVKGSALFYRAFAYAGLADEFAAPALTSGQKPGIPIRTTSDVTVISGRGTVSETYGQIIADLQQAVPLLPVHASFKSRPSRTAAWALLARVYLVMGNYSQAKVAADSCLSLAPALVDYNTLDPAASRPFPSPLPDDADEVLFYATLISTSSYNSSSSTLVDTALYGSYADGDLRKVLFFNHKGPGVTVFKGNYSGTSGMFGGLSLDEIWLIRAECEARGGNIDATMSDLNTLLKSRWLTGNFVPLTAASADQALELVLTERRKELVARGLRWSDLRRLNPEQPVTLQRTVNGQEYSLQPGSENYVLPIPDNELHGSGIAQNPRN